VKLRKIAVWGFLIAGVLGVITGLRDTFAPGFFNISPQVKTKADIILQFVSAATFFALAFLVRLSSQQDANKKQ
jgi:Na+-driven multidrug efflux pump